MTENNFEIVTTTDKDQRDRLFQDLRRNGNQLEKQVVRFSSNERIVVSSITNDGTIKPLSHPKQYSLTGRLQIREDYRSTWSVAYPNKPDSNPTDRRRRHDEQH